MKKAAGSSRCKTRVVGLRGPDDEPRRACITRLASLQVFGAEPNHAGGGGCDEQKGICNGECIVEVIAE
jgi:hypothetical protein